jgi:Zn-dependent oligopeptidase
MNTEQFRKLINLVEARDPNVDYEPRGKEIVAKLRSHKSGVYTRLANNIEQIEQHEAEIKRLKEIVKQDTRENIADLFDASDAVHTRVVETISVVFTLSKDPEPTVSPKYKDILEELSTHLTPELLAVLNKLKEKMVTVTQKQPSLKIKKLDEGELTNAVLNWAESYDQRLDAIKQELGI